MLIIHGDDTSQSYQYLNKQTAPTVVRVDAKITDEVTLRQTLDSSGLFNSDRLIIITNLFASKKKGVLDLVKKYQKEPVIVYETQLLTPTQLKAFSTAQTMVFKLPAIIFKFLDSLAPNSANKTIPLYQELLDHQEPAELIFAMIVRQVRLLIQALNPNNLQQPTWQRQKLANQAKLFGASQLLAFHHQLYQIDKNLKTGKNPINLETRIFSLLTNL